MASQAETYVLFELAGATYAMPSSSVQHIEMMEHVTLVPNAHRAIDGVVFSRGQVIPALNLRARFGFPRQERTLRTRVIFAQVQRRVVGMIVDSAREFKNIPAASVRPIEQALTGVSGNYLRGLTTVNDRLILILDLEAVLNLDKDESLATSLSEVIASGAQPTPAALAH
ncbi:MAG TPA: chemotaxis protein CheW [Verrucomicrobiae bacterium]|jgi:purine-binding chemotaxis protein CheW|nr:chemotaxis protein CheW [Verrucomicrobiae bacterium]